LPEMACEAGAMALAGETSCREVAPCAAGTFGDIVVDADTEYVDASFSGVPNGSATAPWPTIQQAIDAAAPGATIAIAAGSYAQHLVVTNKAVKLWGVCPRDVEIVGPAEGVAAIDIINGPDGTEVHTLAVRGARVGIGTSDALDVVLDRVWVHDTGDQGLLVDAILGPASASVHDSLVESTGTAGVVVTASTVDFARNEVRDTFGRGIDVMASLDGRTPADVSIADVVVDRTDGGGIVVAGSIAEVTRAVVRDTDPGAQERNWGVGLFDVPGFPPANVSLVDSVVERSHDVGVVASASAALVDGVSIRDVTPTIVEKGGPGLIVEAWTGTSLVATATVRQSLVERGNTLGVYVGGASGVVLEGLLVRDTTPNASGDGGWGIAIQDDKDIVLPAKATLRYSLVERTHGSGIFVVGSEVSIEATAVRDTSSSGDGRFGSALTVLDNLMTGLRSNVNVHASLFDRSMEAGVVVAGSDVSIAQSLIRQTVPNALGTQGDGILVMSYAQVGHLELLGTRVEQSQRAGISCFGGAAEIGSSVLACHSFAMDSERFADKSCTLSDLGGNACGCETLESSCKAVSAALEPPAEVETPYDPDH
jgi:hypothetical protein